jgi:hypothetical protein
MKPVLEGCDIEKQAHTTSTKLRFRERSSFSNPTGKKVEMAAIREGWAKNRKPLMNGQRICLNDYTM